MQPLSEAKEALEGYNAIIYRTHGSNSMAAYGIDFSGRDKPQATGSSNARVLTCGKDHLAGRTRVANCNSESEE